jgi:hypothetical protein
MLDDLVGVVALALRDGLRVRDDLYLFDTKLAWQLTNEAHVQEAQRLGVYSALESHPELKRVLGMHLNTGLNAPRVTREALGDWLLTRAMRIGPETAVQDLRVVLEKDCLLAEEHLAISGLEVAAPIQLPGGITLLPIQDVPESVLTISLTDPQWSNFKRNASGHVIRKSVEVLSSFGRSDWHTDPHVATAVLRVEHTRCPAFVPSPAEFASANDLMLDAVRVVAAATCVAVFPVAHWIAPRPDTPLWNYFSWSHWYHLSALREFARADTSVDAITSALTHWMGLAASMKKRLLVPLDRLNRALAAPTVLDAAIDLGVSLEALLLSDLSSHDQISLAFRLRGAWLLGRDAAERRALLQHFNAIYACRSAVAHRGELPSDKLGIDGTKVIPADFIGKAARQLAARTILRVMERGSLPDWTHLLVGSDDTVTS